MGGDDRGPSDEREDVPPPPPLWSGRQPPPPPPPAPGWTAPPPPQWPPQQQPAQWPPQQQPAQWPPQQQPAQWPPQQPPQQQPPWGPGAFAPNPWVTPAISRASLAGWWMRVAAHFVDVGLALAIGAAVGAIAHANGSDGDSAIGYGFIFGLSAWVMNTSALLARTGGRSIGKALAGMRIVRADGTPIGAGKGFVRDFLCRLLYILPVFGLVDSLMAVGEDKRTVRDRMVGTYVVRLPSYGSRTAALVVAAVLLSAAWAVPWAYNADWSLEDGRYTSLDREAFVQGCSEDEDVSESRCGCAFEYIKDHLPYDEYAEADRTENPDDWTPRVRRVVVRAFRRC